MKRLESLDNLSIEQVRSLLIYLTQRMEELEKKEKTTRTAKNNDHSDEEDFVIPPKRVRNRSPQAVTMTETQNRFEILSQEENDMNDNENNDEQENIEAEEEIDEQQETTSKLPRKTTWMQAQKEKMAHTPITIKRREDWKLVENMTKAHKVNYTRATTTRHGIRIQPQTIDDYRKLRKLLETNEIPMTTHTLRDERPLKIVAKGIPTEFTTEELEEDLRAKGYPTRKITRMTGREKRQLPMVLIDIERKYKSIYEIDKIMGINIQLEGLRRREIIQCHRCQEYGHVQRNCTAEYRCLKCGENHSTHLCVKERTTPAKCANCDGPHPANSIKCPKKPIKKFPDKIQAWRTQQTTAKPFKEIIREQKEEKRNPKKTEDRKEENPERKKKITEELSELLLEVSKLNPTEEQTIKITSKIIQITRLL